ncbi:MAG: hypothetical protein V4589_05535 [Bacteroidota bacterium]
MLKYNDEELIHKNRYYNNHQKAIFNYVQNVPTKYYDSIKFFDAMKDNVLIKDLMNIVFDYYWIPWFVMHDISLNTLTYFRDCPQNIKSFEDEYIITGYIFKYVENISEYESTSIFVYDKKINLSDNFLQNLSKGCIRRPKVIFPGKGKLVCDS